MDSYKNLIFDFDGTIADTLPFTINAAIEINNKLGLLENQKIDFEYFRSVDSTEFFEKLEIPKLKLLYFVLKYQRRLVKKLDEINTFDGMTEVLHEIKRRGVDMGIVTSNSSKNVNIFLENNNLKYFDFVYSSINYFNKSKMLNRAIRKYNMDKNNVVYIGDEVRDIQAAKTSGIKVCAVTWGYNFETVLSKYNPDYIVSRPIDLLDLIN